MKSPTKSYYVYNSVSFIYLYIYVLLKKTNSLMISSGYCRSINQPLPHHNQLQAVCTCQCVPHSNVEKVGISMQNYKNIYNQHANTTNRIVCVLHACLTQVTVQTAALHVSLPTLLPSVLVPSSSLPAPLSPRCGISHQFHSHGPAIFQPVASYMLPHLIYYLYQ